MSFVRLKKLLFFTVSAGAVVFLVPTKTYSAQFQKVSASVLFKQKCEQSYLEPGWILADFLAMPLSEFDEAWAYLVSVMQTRPQSLSKNRQTVVAHCVCYDQFLKDLVVDVAHKRIFLAGGAIRTYTQKPEYITIFQYWQAKKNTTYHHFYAFYFDQVAAQFIEAISVLFFNSDSTEYADLQRKARAIGVQLSEIFNQLKDTEYDARYAHHLQRYIQVFQLIAKERAAARSRS